jgi:EmrB/QacA subfamily drug resistance transporter
VIDAYLIVLASLLLTSGAAGDRLGRRRVFRAGLVIFTVGSAACSLAPNLGTLIVFRMVQAVGASMLPPTSLSIIASTFPDRGERAQAMGVWGAVSGLSTASGPLLGGALIHLIGWRAIFWINIPIGIIGLLLARRYVENSRAARPRRIDLPGQILADATLATLSFGLIQAPARGWWSPLIVSLLASSVVAAAAFVVVERRRTEPLLDLRFFTDPAFSAAAAVATLVFVCLTGFTFISTLYLQNVRGDSPLTAGLSLLPATAIVVVAAPLSGRLTRRRGPRLPVLLAAGSITAGMSVLAMTDTGEPYWRLSIGYLLVGIGVGLVNAPITTTAVSSLPPDQAGVAAGVTGTARQVDSIVGVTLLGSIVISRYHSLLPQRSGNAGIAFTEASHRGFLLAAGCGALAGLIATFTFKPNDRRKARD